MCEIGKLKLDSHRRNRWGHLIVDTTLAKVGIVSRVEDGITKNEFISEKALFDNNSLESLKSASVTQFHPEINGNRIILDSHNTPDFEKGVNFSEPRKVVNNGETFLESTIIIKSEPVIQDVLNGITPEVSLGYTALNIPKTGDYKGQSYNFEQTNRVINHIALVPPGTGRAGREVRVKTDSKTENEFFIYQDIKADSKENKKDNNDNGQKETISMLIEVNGIKQDVNIPKESEFVLQSKFKADSDLMSEMKVKIENLEKQAGEKDAEIKQLKEEVSKFDNVDLRALAQDRINLENEAKLVLGDEYKFDGKSDLDIKRDSLAKNDPTGNWEKQSDAYIEGGYNFLIKNLKTDNQESNKQFEIQRSAGAGATMKTDNKDDIDNFFDNLNK